MNKLINKISLALCAAVLLAACDINRYNPNTPRVFNDKDAFVAFDKTEVNCQEDFEGVVRIPVTLASVAGLEETIPFRIVTPETKAAKEGVNYEILTTSGTLSFNADKRTDYIEFTAKPDGEYTGDLKFQIELIETESINIGESSICTVTIGDVDHPLGFLAGSYTMHGNGYWDGECSWACELVKDASDDHKIWFTDLNNMGWSVMSRAFYGNVSEDFASIDIPFGQETSFTYNDLPFTLAGTDNNLSGTTSGSTTVTITVKESGGVHLDFGEYGFAYVQIESSGWSWFNFFFPGLTADKN